MESTQQDYDALRRLHESTNEALRNAEAEIAALRAALALLEQKERQWEADKVRQMAVIHTALERANATSNGYLTEVERLRAELREARG